MITNWTAVWVLFAGALTAGAQLTKVPPALPGLRAEFGLTLVQSGFAQTMVYAIGAAVGVLFGAAADRFGQKRAALAGLALMTLGGVLGATAPGFRTLLASRFLEGLGFILYVVGATPLLVAATLPKDRAAAFGLWSAYMPAGGALALLLVPMAMQSVGWRGLWLAVAGYTALSALALVHWVPSAAFGNQAGSLRLVRESLARPGALFLCLAFICYVGQWTSIMTWLPTFVVDERGASIGVAALVTAAFVAINIPGTLLGGLLLQRGHSRTAVLAGGALAMGTAAIGLFSSLPDGVRLACALAFSLVGGVIPTAVFAGTPVHAQSPAHIGTMNGMVMQASHLSQFVLPIVFAWVASRAGGWSASLGTLLVLAACGVFAALGVGRYERR